MAVAAMANKEGTGMVLQAEEPRCDRLCAAGEGRVTARG